MIKRGLLIFALFFILIDSSNASEYQIIKNSVKKQRKYNKSKAGCLRRFLDCLLHPFKFAAKSNLCLSIASKYEEKCKPKHPNKQSGDNKGFMRTRRSMLVI
jgi:hypothetical protein